MPGLPITSGKITSASANIGAQSEERAFPEPLTQKNQTSSAVTKDATKLTPTATVIDAGHTLPEAEKREALAPETLSPEASKTGFGAFGGFAGGLGGNLVGGIINKVGEEVTNAAASQIEGIATQAGSITQVGSALIPK